jgi:DNA ligase (NAD+)
MKTEKLESLKQLYLEAKEAYYNTENTIMSDDEFDELEDIIKKYDPKWKELKKTGVSVKKFEAPLYHPAPSLNKAYPEAIHKFINKYSDVKEWVVMDKLDGTSLQLIYKQGRPYKLLTRGDGILGGDVSHLLNALIKAKKIPGHIPYKEIFVLRLEGVMAKSTFFQKWSKFILEDKGFENSRNMVNGIFNRKDSHVALKDIQLVVLGVYNRSLLVGLKQAENAGFEVINYKELRSISTEKLTSLLEQRKIQSEFEMDGLVIAPYDFHYMYKDAEKPKEIIAFKFNNIEEAAEVKVEEVIWQKTRLKRWQPKIRITPTKMDGVMVQNVTAHNPTLMIEKGIGPGAIVKVLRSGGVIPKIVGVIKKAKFVPPPGQYLVKGRFFYMLEHDETTEIRSIHHFMVSLGIELLAQKTIAKLYEELQFTSPKSYIHLIQKKDSVIDDRLQSAGLGPVQTVKIRKELKRVLCSSIKLKSLMVASGKFENGMGEKRLTQLENHGISMYDLYHMDKDKMYNTINNLHGFKEKTTVALVEGIVAFRKWLRPLENLLEIDGKLPVKKIVKQGILTGYNISFTTYRDKQQEAKIEELVGKVISFSGKTDILLYKKGNKQSSKIDKAGDKAMTWEEFVSKFNL